MELFVVEGPDAGRSFALGPQAVIGRDPTAAVNLVDEEVSRRHALISMDKGHAMLEDLGSSNGTFVGSAKISSETELQPGQRMRVGQTVMELRVSERVGDPENLPATKVPLPKLGDRPQGV
ncbi:MAG: FHA domain-containing protein [Gemmatimonadales bacterium]